MVRKGPNLEPSQPIGADAKEGRSPEACFCLGSKGYARQKGGSNCRDDLLFHMVSGVNHLYRTNSGRARPYDPLFGNLNAIRRCATSSPASRTPRMTLPDRKTTHGGVVPMLPLSDAWNRYEAIRNRLPAAASRPTPRMVGGLLEVAGEFDGFLFDSFGVQIGRAHV